MANTIIEGPDFMWLPELEGRPGYEQPLWDFFLWTFGLGVEYDVENGTFRANRRTPIRNYRYFATDYIGMVVRQQGEIIDYPAYVKRDRDQMAEDVPNYMLLSTITDGEPPTERQRRWFEYNANAEATQTDPDTWYVPTNGMGPYNPGTVLHQLINDPQYEVLNEYEVSQIPVTLPATRGGR